MTTPRLLPCPCCGGPARFAQQECDGYAVECATKRCVTSGEIHYACGDEPAPIMAAQAHLLPVCVIRRRRRYDPPRSNPIDTDPCAALRDEELQREFNLGLDNLGLDKLRRELPCRLPCNLQLAPHVILRKHNVDCRRIHAE